MTLTLAYYLPSPGDGQEEKESWGSSKGTCVCLKLTAPQSEESLQTLPNTSWVTCHPSSWPNSAPPLPPQGKRYSSAAFVHWFF